jgi:hypothetical protein
VILSEGRPPDRFARCPAPRALPAAREAQLGARGSTAPPPSPTPSPAGQLLLEETGGRLTDFGDRRVASADVTDVVATNGAVHDELLAVLGASGG